MNTTARYQFDPKTIEASDREWKTHRLTSYNEKIQLLLSKILGNRSFEEIDADKNMSKDEKYCAPHLAVGLGVVRPVVLCCGDPFRSKIIAEMCDTHVEVAWNREYRMYNVTYEGADMTIVSHGIGGPGAAICFEELIKLGATTIIRLGTCGSLKPKEIMKGQLVVSTSACREDGHSSWMAPPGFPAVADPRVALALYDQAKSLNYEVHMGITLTSGNFYPGPAVAGTLQVNADAGALSVEMENATLFCIGSVRGIRTGAIATIDGSPFNWDDGDYDPHGTIVAEGKIRMI
jgi:uridine phosphorylase